MRPCGLLPLTRFLHGSRQQFLVLSGLSCRRSYSDLHDDFAARAVKDSSIVQTYRSSSTDPYVNLSIEHFLLERSPPHSTVLFLYVNKPCVVIGRNQNPWLETNLSKLATGLERDNELGERHNVMLVRRRSGGGAVFHDEGNLNYSVICPPGEFNRDKHALMMVRALRAAGAEKSGRHLRVNERHDIVLDTKSRCSNHNDEGQEINTLKVSGSAYKLTRHRALHHGTCLLSSPNLTRISSYLRSPASPFIKAKGVESVKSPVGNLFARPDSASDHLIPESLFSKIKNEFLVMYGATGAVEGSVGDSTAQAVPRIVKGLAELQSADWKYLQTPQFIFSSHPTEDDPRPRPPLPAELPSSARAFLRVKSGRVVESRISLSDDPEAAALEAEDVHVKIQDRKLHEMGDWKEILALATYPIDSPIRGYLAHWLSNILSTAV